MAHSIAPSGILKNYVESYYIVEINDTAEFLPVERVFPHGNPGLVFHYGSPSKFRKKDSDEYVEPGLVICGQQSTYYDLSLSGKTGMILVVFKPHGAKAFFDCPAGELSDRNIAVQDLIKNAAGELEEVLHDTAGNRQRIALIETFLLGRLVPDKDFARIEHAVNIIENSKGQVKTCLLASEVCLGIKQFERIFTKHVGLSPKKFSNIIRFRNVLQNTNKLGDKNLSHIAFDNGYFDQSHFIHDFRSFTGLAPGEFFNNTE